MNQAALQLAIFAIEEAIKLEPILALEFGQLFSNGMPTPEEFAAFRKKVAGESYFAFVPASAIPQSDGAGVTDQAKATPAATPEPALGSAEGDPAQPDPALVDQVGNHQTDHAGPVFIE